MLEGDWIQIHDLKISTRIGIYPWEQHINQTLLINLALLMDFSAPITDLSQSIDYASLCEQVTIRLESERFELIETVAQVVADMVLSTYQVKQVRVSVKKCHAIANASGVSVSLTRSHAT